MNKTLIIIGAGVAGLSAGCYAQMNGYSSSIYEMHFLPGGLCTSWKRGDYTFDGCIDWLTGSGPNSMLYSLWQEVGVIQNNHFIYHEEYCRYIGDDGRTVTIYLDIDRLEKELKGHSKEDGLVIEEICNLIRVLRSFKPNVSKAAELMNMIDYLKMMPDMMKHKKQYQAFLKYGRISMSEFAAKFKCKTLRDMFESIWGSSFPVSLFAATMAWCSNHTAGYPEGGSLKLARDIEKKYLDLSGTIHYKQRVEKILVENNKAIGIQLADGSQKYADSIISAADGHSTITRMLGNQYSSDKIKEWYEYTPTFPPYIQISLGINCDMQSEPKMIYWKLNRPLMIAKRETDYMLIHNYAFDRKLAPKGKTSLVIRFFTDYHYWQERYNDKKSYREEKNALAQMVINQLDELFSGIKERIEQIDVATPTTYTRYTGTWQGATMSWLPTTKNFGKNIEKTLPGLKNFYMAGQWLTPGGGVPTALLTGRDAIQLICKKDKMKFQTC